MPAKFQISTPDPSGIPDLIAIVLSTVVISGINIIISGHIIGQVFNLSSKGNYYFSIRIPLMIHLGVTGDRALAGFAAFTLSLVITGFFFHQMAVELIINNMSATQDKWIAIQCFAAALSLIVCLFIMLVKIIGSYVILTRLPTQRAPQSREERARHLTGEEE